MRTQHQAIAAAEVYSPAEEAFNRKRRTAGLFAAPIVFVLLLLAPFDLPAPAQRTAAILVTMVVLWLTEALPLAATALLGPVLAVLLQVGPARDVLAPFADPIIFLIIGSFILAQAMFVHGIDRRIAFTALSVQAVGRGAFQILLVYGAVCTGLSLWISNTAATAMMFPIGLSIVGHVARVGTAHPAQVRNFAMAMMLITAFGASIGGIGTPVGTPPNLIGIGMLERLAGVDISFFQWMLLGIPIVIVLFACLLLQFYLTSIRGLPVAHDGTALVRDELKRLGTMSRAQWNVVTAFLTTVALWVAPGVFTLLNVEGTPFARAYEVTMPEGIAALIGALLLFVLPVEWRSRRFTMTWE
jgi:sodium-dependent dicarboxylate transporter 2/3/5